ncbi:MAG: hypothetical protein ACE5NC_08265 [Anaerolineae bacterium]
MDEQKAYLQEMAQRRGYVLDYHKVLVAEDLAFMRALNDFLAVSYTDQRRLDRKTKELVHAADGRTAALVRPARCADSQLGFGRLPYLRSTLREGGGGYAAHAGRPGREAGESLL